MKANRPPQDDPARSVVPDQPPDDRDIVERSRRNLRCALERVQLQVQDLRRDGNRREQQRRQERRHEMPARAAPERLRRRKEARKAHCLYSAVPGWDASTGLGTPNVAVLLSDLIAKK